MEYQCTREQFLKDIKDHQMEIIEDDGVNRHIVFSRPSTSSYRFVIKTWAGYLLIFGDMGCYVFSRIHDMFEFFIMKDTDFNKKHIIDPHYWSEKLRSISCNYGHDASIEEFSKEKAEQFIKEKYDEWCENIENEEEKKELWKDIELSILSNLEEFGNPDFFYKELCDFSYTTEEKERFSFDYDEFPDFKEYRFRYIWICYAIVWGILKYNEFKKLGG